MTPSEPTEPAGPNDPHDAQHTEQYPVAHGPQAPHSPYQYTPYDRAQYANLHQQPHPAAPASPAAQHPSLRGYRIALGATAAVAAAALVATGVAISNDHSVTITGSGSAQEVTPNNGSGSGSGSTNPGSGSGSTDPGSTDPGSGGGTFPFPGGGSGGTGSGGTSASSIALATKAQKVGVVTVVSTLGYQNAEGAGTGMVLSSDGEILTNNHVVNGATSITVTVVSTGKSYRADVVGTDPTGDVAVIQLRNANGLKKANLGDSDDVKVGDSIIGVGNAGGTGTLRASKGKVTALNQSITATDESGANAERLHGLIGVDAGIVAGDSGGPTYDSAGEIIGMNTAASQSQTGATASAYSIPIDNALQIADEIANGKASSTIHIGLPGFLGVGVANASGGVGVTSVVPNGPADQAGIAAGSVITAIDGKHVASATALKSAMSGHKAKDTVKVTWTDASGVSHTSNVTLIAGPAD